MTLRVQFFLHLMLRLHKLIHLALKRNAMALGRHHDTQHNYNLYNYTQYNDMQNNDKQNATLSIMTERCYAEFRSS